MIVLALEGRKRALNAYLRDVDTSGNFEYHLYSNAYTPTGAMTLADFTESAYPGYASQNVDTGDWGAPVDDGTCAQCTASNLTYTATGPSAESAVGYYILSTLDGDLLYAEEFPGGPVDMSAAGRTLTITPTYNNQTGAPC